MRIQVILNRDSVHPGDDVGSHATTIDADANMPIGALLLRIQHTYLPRIAGGEATWTVTCSGPAPSPLGVVAQQWTEPRLRVSTNTRISQLFGADGARITFQYRCQENPDFVFSKLAVG